MNLQDVSKESRSPRNELDGECRLRQEVKWGRKEEFTEQEHPGFAAALWG